VNRCGKGRIGFEVLTLVPVKDMIFRVVRLCSSEEAGRFGGIYRLHCVAYSPTVKIEAICFSQKSGVLRTTRRCNTQDGCFRVGAIGKYCG
jgi:hypothetical protein